MVKRRKQEKIAGVLEFAGCFQEDPTFKRWVAEHRAQNGGNLRMSKGATGVRVMFSKEADITSWTERSEAKAKAKDRKHLRHVGAMATCPPAAPS